ncbi:MAG: hypothetical protein J6M53_04510 [Bacteroidaceae bacterium]|nr:hypothetical protein [Bacteroidaceae bacterium]
MANAQVDNKETNPASQNKPVHENPVVIDGNALPVQGNPSQSSGKQEGHPDQPANASATVGNEGEDAQGENAEQQEEEEARPAAPRTRTVVKKDLSRRVVLRRVTRSGVVGAQGRVLREGYRIQIYTGGNRRQDRQRADALGEKCRQYFPELSAYSHFACPRWTCRVGDFEKIEQASRYVSLILRSKVSVEARIVKCMVWLPVN